MIFGSRDVFATFIGVTLGLIVITPLVVAILSRSITGFVTRGENTKIYLSDYTVIAFLASSRKNVDGADWAFGIFAHICLSLIAGLLGILLGATIWHTPVWVYILTAVIAVVLLTARFAYTLKSKFDKHLEKLHEGADKDDYDIKW